MQQLLVPSLGGQCREELFESVAAAVGSELGRPVYPPVYEKHMHETTVEKHIVEGS